MKEIMNEKKLDWHLFWTAASVILILTSVIVGCYVSLKTELNTIKTVLILKGIMPKELAMKDGEK